MLKVAMSCTSCAVQVFSQCDHWNCATSNGLERSRSSICFREVIRFHSFNQKKKEWQGKACKMVIQGSLFALKFGNFFLNSAQSLDKVFEHWKQLMKK
jgi:hypothetical protein